MRNFVMNGIFWRVETVDPGSPYLIDRTNTSRLATTDPNTYHIYLSSELNEKKGLLDRVIIHELGHAVMVSYDLFSDIHRMIKPQYWIEMEEWICNFIADYGLMTYSIAKSIAGDDALKIIPAELEKLVA